MTSPSSYEAVPYLSNAFSHTHPLRLQSIGKLFGINAPNANSCRALELGCSSGINLCAMASTLPQSRFVGIDFAETHIAQARQMLSELALENVELIRLDIAELDEGFGKFDYIICHGLFSWVKSEIQQKVLQICREQLQPEGIAYISYNTLPGWYPRRMIREMLLYHADQFRDSDLFVDQARGMVTLLSESLRNNDAPLSTFLKNSLKQIQGYPDWFFRHDVLEDINEPIYFHQFAAMAGEAGLQYLGDSDLPKMADVSFPADVRQALRLIGGDVVRFEQYLDFLWNRSFRRSLLCHKELTVTRELAPRRVQESFIVSSLREAKSPGATGIERFENPIGGFLETNDPVAVPVLRRLSQVSPQSVAFSELFADAEEKLNAKFPFTPEARLQEQERLSLTIWNLAIRELVEIQAAPFPFVIEVSEYPRASRMARWQARMGTDVTNQRHEVISLDANSAVIVCLLDGLSTVESIYAALPGEQGQSMEELELRLSTLAAQALLEG